MEPEEGELVDDQTLQSVERAPAVPSRGARPREFDYRYSRADEGFDRGYSSAKRDREPRSERDAGYAPSFGGSDRRFSRRSTSPSPWQGSYPPSLSRSHSSHGRSSSPKGRRREAETSLERWREAARQKAAQVRGPPRDRPMDRPQGTTAGPVNDLVLRPVAADSLHRSYSDSAVEGPKKRRSRWGAPIVAAETPAPRGYSARESFASPTTPSSTTPRAGYSSRDLAEPAFHRAHSLPEAKGYSSRKPKLDYTASSPAGYSSRTPAAGYEAKSSKKPDRFSSNLKPLTAETPTGSSAKAGSEKFQFSNRNPRAAGETPTKASARGPSSASTEAEGSGRPSQSTKDAVKAALAALSASEGDRKAMLTSEKESSQAPATLQRESSSTSVTDQPAEKGLQEVKKKRPSWGAALSKKTRQIRRQSSLSRDDLPQDPEEEAKDTSATSATETKGEKNLGTHDARDSSAPVSRAPSAVPQQEKPSDIKERKGRSPAQAVPTATPDVRAPAPKAKVAPSAKDKHSSDSRPEDNVTSVSEAGRKPPVSTASAPSLPVTEVPVSDTPAAEEAGKPSNKSTSPAAESTSTPDKIRAPRESKDVQKASESEALQQQDEEPQPPTSPRPASISSEPAEQKRELAIAQPKKGPSKEEENEDEDEDDEEEEGDDEEEEEEEEADSKRDRTKAKRSARRRKKKPQTFEDIESSEEEADEEDAPLTQNHVSCHPSFNLGVPH